MRRLRHALADAYLGLAIIVVVVTILYRSVWTVPWDD